jgi:multisubunit Na+/H+ antiporter MnhG subunit
MKSLLIVMALVEAATGLALLLAPSLPVLLLFDASFDAPAALTVGRIAGAALLVVGVACWLARKDEQRRAASGLVAAMLFYNIAAVLLLAYAGTASGLRGIGLWPAVVLHAALAIWCIAGLRSKVQGGNVLFPSGP